MFIDELVREKFSPYYVSEKDITKIEKNKGMQLEYYIKSNINILFCITVDFKELDFDFYYMLGVDQYESVPLKKYEMIHPIKSYYPQIWFFSFPPKTMEERAEKCFSVMLKFISTFFD